MKYFLYGHNGSGNHGCEAIVRSTYKLLNSDENSFVLATGNKDEDKKVVESIALNEENVKKNICNKEVVKVIVVPNRIVNIVVK